MKLASDMMLFLMAKPTLNALWWEIARIYSENIGFTKNLAEGNFIQFKEFAATYKFSSREDTGFNPKQLTITEFLSSQMLYLLNWSLVRSVVEK